VRLDKDLDKDKLDKEKYYLYYDEIDPAVSNYVAATEPSDTDVPQPDPGVGVSNRASRELEAAEEADREPEPATATACRTCREPEAADKAGRPSYRRVVLDYREPEPETETDCRDYRDAEAADKVGRPSYRRVVLDYREPEPVAETADEDDQEPNPQDKDQEKRKNFFSWVRFIVIWLVIGVLISQFVLQRNTVFGDSMVPNLYNGDELLVEKISRYFGGISRGDIITCRSQLLGGKGETYIVKRVIGLPGESVEIKDGQVHIDGNVLEENYLPAGLRTDAIREEFQSVVLAEDEYYLMGDNRPQSQDSRYFGPVKKKDISGEVLIRFYPFNRFGRPR
jgi:signal peptidase I